MASDSEKKSRNANGKSCPECNKADQVQRVSVVVDGGTSFMSGVTTSVNFVGPNSVSVGGFAGVQASNLASRLQIQIPSASFRFSYLVFGGLLGWFFAGRAVFDSMTGEVNFFYYFLSAGIGIFGAIPGVLVGVIIAFASRAIEARRLTPTTQAAYRTQERLRASYYCLRDDIVFNQDTYGSPDEVAELIFSEELA
jgi:hypothetical protein